MVASSAVYTRVEAPPVVPRPYGLFSVAAPQSPADPHWQVGVSWESWACLDPNTTTDACFQGTSPPAKEFEQCPHTQVVAPLTVYLGVKRSGGMGDAEASASGALTGAEEFAVERWLWGQMVAAAAPTAPGVGAAVHPNPTVAALAAVESALGAGYMGAGVIHMGRGVATALGDMLTVKGSQLQTAAGTPVVAGSGYNLDALTGGKVAIYGTGAIAVRRSTIDTSTAWDRQVNDELSVAERNYVVGWDCFVVGRTTS